MKSNFAYANDCIHCFLPEALNISLYEAGLLAYAQLPVFPSDVDSDIRDSATLCGAYSSGNCSGIAPVFPFNPHPSNRTQNQIRMQV